MLRSKTGKSLLGSSKMSARGLRVCRVAGHLDVNLEAYS